LTWSAALISMGFIAGVKEKLGKYRGMLLDCRARKRH